MTVLAVREKRDIEQLVIWALRDQGLGWAGKERVRDDFSDLGTIIDDDNHGSHPTIALWSDDDAMQIKLAIDQLHQEARALVVQYGRAALRPDWCEEGYGSYQQLVDGRGRKLWDWDDAKNRQGNRRPRMGFVGEQRDTVNFHRAQWHVWWQGLADIVSPLNAVMARHEATGPAVGHSPWLDDSAKPVVFGPDGSPLDQVIRSPKVSVEAVETLRARASDPIAGRANDWSAPAKVIRRRRTR
ncbi:hypothetical protein [Devosia sp. 2618]|uniref:hypothetical protein n=1 Tax=Devosia sp. 2618 TaxID=3156454 RepID=UPI003396C829